MMHYVLTQCGFNKGLQNFKNKGANSAIQEFKKLHEKNKFDHTLTAKKTRGFKRSHVS